MRADEAAIKELEDILMALKTVRDLTNRENTAEAKRVLENSINGLVDLINDCDRAS